MSAPKVIEFPASSNPLALDWHAIEHRAIWCPYLDAAVTQVRAGTLTREEALMWAALALSGSLSTLRDDYVALLRGHLRTLV